MINFFRVTSVIYQCYDYLFCLIFRFVSLTLQPFQVPQNSIKNYQRPINNFALAILVEMSANQIEIYTFRFYLHHSSRKRKSIFILANFR